MTKIKLIAKILVVPVVIMIGLYWWSGTGVNYAAWQPEIQARGAGIIKANHWVLENGAHVYHLAQDALPMVDVQVVFDAGSAHDGDNPGLARLTNALLAQGTTDYTADELAIALEDLGSEYNLGSHRDMAFVQFRTLSESSIRHQAVALWAQMLAHPAFHEDDVVRVKRNTLVALKRQAEEPGEIAEKTFYSAVFGNQPYGHWPAGTTDTVSSISADMLKAYFERFYTTRNMVIAIVGDVDEAEANHLALQLTKDMSQASVDEMRTQAMAYAEPVSTQHIDFPSQQTHLYMGTLGVPRHDPDYVPLMVGHHVLVGSGMSSLLFDKVRNEKGLAYHVGGQLTPLQQGGVFFLKAQTRNAEVDETLATIKKELAAFIALGPEAERLQAAKDNMTGAYPLQFASNQDLMSALAHIGFYQLPLDYYDTFLSAVASVRAEDIQAAWARHFQPEQLSIITVGQKG